MTKLKKDRLDDYLQDWHTSCSSSYSPQLSLGGCKKMCDLHDECEEAYEQIKELIQKPEVTEEWIEEKARAISHAFNDIHRVGMEQARDFIRSLVEEIKT